MPRFKALVLTAISLVFTAPRWRNKYKKPSSTLNTVVIDVGLLAATKQRLKQGDKALEAALHHLTAQSDPWMNQGPWTVTSKAKAPPNGTVHNYVSQAPYWWPNPNSAGGCPDVQKATKTALRVGKMFNSGYVLGLAWYYTHDPEYSQHAATILRTWFRDDATKMCEWMGSWKRLPAMASLLSGRRHSSSIALLRSRSKRQGTLDASQM